MFEKVTPQDMRVVGKMVSEMDTKEFGKLREQVEDKFQDQIKDDK